MERFIFFQKITYGLIRCNIRLLLSNRVVQFETRGGSRVLKRASEPPLAHGFGNTLKICFPSPFPLNDDFSTKTFGSSKSRVQLFDYISSLLLGHDVRESEGKG
jgi:hypothetical protein